VLTLASIRALVGSGLSFDPSSLPRSSGLESSTPPASSSTDVQGQYNVKPQEQDKRGGWSSKPNSKVIPITVLSGFLGSGKTSVLRNLLNNDRGLRIAVIVNDMASVNIDSKLVSQQQQQEQKWNGVDAKPPRAAGIVQLENGCACCSLSEELLGSVSELVLLSDLQGEQMGYDHIVVELSGVADPRAVRAKFQEAILYDMPLMERVRLDTMVTLVDCSTFVSHLSNPNLASREQSPELYYWPGEKPSTGDVPDWAKDLPGPLLEALLARDRVYDGKRSSEVEEGASSVVDLLVSQCEIADVCLLNKMDLCDGGDDDLRRISGIVQALNPRASLYPCRYGDVDLDKVLAVAGGHGVVESGLVDDHKDAVRAAIPTTLLPELAPSSTSRNRRDPTHLSPNHSHQRHHDHGHDDPHSCTDPSHSHDHDHQPSQAHADDYSADSCGDRNCSDPSHSHHHSHDHSSSSYFGLGSFVYRARRPFHPGRLVSLLRRMPVRRGLPPLQADGSTPVGGLEVDPSIDRLVVNAEVQQALNEVIRSKGFAWSAESDVAAFYWSHAGVSFDWSCLGRWWATLERKSWPPEAVSAILSDFVSDQILAEDPSLDFVGDRRQEIVFIGPSLGSSRSQEAVSAALDQCLLNDEEWQAYRRLRVDDRELQARFPNPIEPRMLTY
jgi:G3E family GTPase